MKKFFLTIIAAAVLVFEKLFTVSPVYAQITINQPSDINSKILCPIFGWMFTFLITISAIMGLVGGYWYMTSRGDSEKVSKATKTITYAAVGVAVALAAKAVPSLISNLFGGGAVSAC